MSNTATREVALPYHEPDISTLLVLIAFLLLLNSVNHILDRIIYTGLLGQIILGIAFGTPGGKLLGNEIETAVNRLGYLGLLLLVYEGQYSFWKSVA
jgi:Kef-type K+ transport system membrane component KefB